jgi:hypothetical protein
MGKLGVIFAFAVAIAAVFVGFAPAGGALGEWAFDVYTSLSASGMSPRTAALATMLGIDTAGLLIAFGVSVAGGVRLPSGLPHVFFLLFHLLTLGATQLRFFELAGNPGGLSDSFSTYNTVAMFIATVAVVQLGVYLSRRWFEGRNG